MKILRTFLLLRGFHHQDEFSLDPGIPIPTRSHGACSLPAAKARCKYLKNQLFRAKEKQRERHEQANESSNDEYNSDLN